MRARVALVAAALAAAGAAVVPAAAETLPSVCNIVQSPVDRRAMLGYDAPSAAVRAVTAAGGRVVGGVPALRALQVAFPTPAARDAALPLLAAAPGVRYAEAERVFTTHRRPKDPYLGYQWGLFKIGAEQAWAKEVGTRNIVTVAVLDTGVDLRHPDLAGRVVAGRDLVNKDEDAMDDHSHGTHVAGIIAAQTNNKVGVAGLSWGARILPVKVLGADGQGSDCDVAYGMTIAADAGAKVLNLSLGSEGPSCGLLTQEAVDYARDAGSLPVVSSGNGAMDGNKTNAPANCERVIAVAATDPNDKIAKFSSHHPYVDVSAPGVGVLSTYFDPKTGRHTYVSQSGTSMAAPFVSGLAALLLSKNPGWTIDQVERRILTTVDDRGKKGKDDYFGAGRINAARALR